MVDILVCLRSVRMDLMWGSQPSSRRLSVPAGFYDVVGPLPLPLIYTSPPLPLPLSASSLSPAPAVTPPPVVTPIPTKTTQKWHLSAGHRRAKLKATPDPGHHAGSIACRCIGTCGLANLAAQKPGTQHPAAAPAFIPSQSGNRCLAVQVPGARQQILGSRQTTTYPPNRTHQEKT